MGSPQRNFRNSRLAYKAPRRCTRHASPNAWWEERKALPSTSHAQGGGDTYGILRDACLANQQVVVVECATLVTDGC